MNYENVLKARKELLERIKKEEQQKNELDLLKMDQIFGDDRLDIFKYGIKAAMTDFAILLGGYVSCIYNKLSNRAGWYWTKNPYGNNTYSVDNEGSNEWTSVINRINGIRLAIPFSSISKICSNEVSKNGLIEIEYGEYPQWVCFNKLGKELEELYIINLLNNTGKSYTTDSKKYSNKFESKEHTEYEYEGKKYVRVIANRNDILSSGKKIVSGDYVWISVSPIKWLVDKKADMAITKNIIVSGIQFNNKSNYDGTNFNEMNIKRFMDKYLSKDIIPSAVYNTSIEVEEETFESMREEARRKLIKIIGDDYNPFLNNSEDNYQKQLKK